jgi:uncharacterized protein (TIGR03067 family)
MMAVDAQKNRSRLWLQTGIALALFGGVAPLAGGGRFVAGEAPQADRANADLDKLQGTWRGTAGWTRGGAPVPDEVMKTSAMVVRGDQMTVTIKDRPGTSWTIRLDPSKSPKEIDTTFNEGPLKGRVFHGIYQLDGDILKLAQDTPMHPGRPTSFEPGSGWGVGIYERVKP